MSNRPHSKSRIKICNRPVFHLQDKKADENELSMGLIKSAKRTGQLSLSNRGLGTGEAEQFIIRNISEHSSKVCTFRSNNFIDLVIKCTEITWCIYFLRGNYVNLYFIYFKTKLYLY